MKLTVHHYPKFDSIGFVPECYSVWHSNGGYIPVRYLSHDLLDHTQTPENGTLEEEFLAIGAMIWRLGHANTPNGFMAISSLIFEEILYTEPTNDMVEYSAGKDAKLDTCWDAAVVEIYSNFASEEKQLELWFSRNKKAIKYFIYEGYRLAQERFKGYNAEHIRMLAAKIDKAIPQMDLIAGQTYELTYDITTLDVNLLRIL